MRVIEREEGAMLVVVYERRVEGAPAEHSSAHEVPKCRADYISVSKIIFKVLMRLDQAIVVDRLDDQQHQRQYFDEGNMLAIGTHMLGPPAQ